MSAHLGFTHPIIIGLHLYNDAGTPRFGGNKDTAALAATRQGRRLLLFLTNIIYVIDFEVLF
jgi:hypothetical protein